MPLATPRIPNYEVLHTIGKGHFGVVKLVRPSTPRPGKGTLLAAKFVQISGQPGRSGEPYARTARCRKEVQLQKQVDSPFVCRVLETMVQDDYFVIIQEYVDGGDLRQLLEHRIAHGALSPGHERILIEVVAGVRACHSFGVVHGDIKPSNILLTSGTSGAPGEPRLIDFGCAEECADAVTGCTHPKGTIQYMAPELWLSQEHGSSVDVWAMGVLLYVMWDGGNFPFPRLSTNYGSPQFMDQYKRTPDFSRHMPSARHAELVRAMLQIEPGQRPTAAEVAAEMADISKTNPTSTPS